MGKTKQPVAKGHNWLGWTQPARSTGVRFSCVWRDFHGGRFRWIAVNNIDLPTDSNFGSV